MAGYSRVWCCRICNERQETIDNPRVAVCTRCLEPLARKLCHASLGVDLGAPGVDRAFWLGRADVYAGALLARWKG
jgi:predicted amidophosphoribosyltransferase